jgi:hypothetical protein
MEIQFHTFLTSAPHVHDLLASCPGRFTLGETLRGYKEEKNFCFAENQIPVPR